MCVLLMHVDSDLNLHSHHPAGRSISLQFPPSSFPIEQVTSPTLPKKPETIQNQSQNANAPPQPHSRALQAKLPTHLWLCLSHVLTERYQQVTVRVSILQDMPHTNELSASVAESESLVSDPTGSTRGWWLSWWLLLGVGEHGRCNLWGCTISGSGNKITLRLHGLSSEDFLGSRDLKNTKDGWEQRSKN
jgi:hypothetical protein